LAEAREAATARHLVEVTKELAVELVQLLSLCSRVDKYLSSEKFLNVVLVIMILLLVARSSIFAS
jgi:hypothetical protein